MVITSPGQAEIDLYTFGTPNGHKASIMLEEVGLDYAVHSINILKDEQFAPEFLKISPNNKIPAIVDNKAEGGPLSIFESGAILVYLAEKTGKFLPTAFPARAKTLEWLFWQVGGLGPMFGQFNHFVRFAKEDVPYGKKRYTEESARLLKVMDKQLSETEYLAGDYSVADISSYAWTKSVAPRVQEELGDDAPDWENVGRWLEAVGARPAVQRGMKVPG